MFRNSRSLEQRWRFRLTFALALAAGFAIASFLAEASRAQQRTGAPSLVEQAPQVRHVTVILNKSQVLHFDRPFKTATIASTAIADVTPLTDRSLYVQGKSIGTTNITVFDETMALAAVIDLEVTIDTISLQRKIRTSTGASGISVSASGNEVVLTGTASDAVAADQSVSLARSMLTQGQILVNAMTVAPSQQVMLKVRFLEATRAAERDLGINFFGANKSGTRGFSTGLGVPFLGSGTATVSGATGTGGSTGTSTGVVAATGSASTGGISVIKSAGALISPTGGVPFGTVLANLVNNGTGSLDIMVSALETKGLVRRLAEPNLVALSGDTAKFLAGGQFPVPTVATTTTSGATPTFQFVQFGVSLSFVPTVLKAGLINLRIAPEVSELDFSNAVTISGTTIPSLLTRNAQTTVELRDGQSFAIAGLLQERNVRAADQVPWIGNVPVLGTLFRSSAYQNSESDLVIIVTPHLVKPATPTDQLATPFDQRLPSNDIDFFLNGQTEVPKEYLDYVTSGGGLAGPYGAIIPVEQGSNQPVYKGSVAK